MVVVADKTDGTELFRARLSKHVGRLAELISIEAPPTILANEIGLLTKAAWGLMSEDMARVEARHRREDARRSAGLCVMCGRHKGHEEDICEKCAVEAAREDGHRG